MRIAASKLWQRFVPVISNGKRSHYQTISNLSRSALRVYDYNGVPQIACHIGVAEAERHLAQMEGET